MHVPHNSFEAVVIWKVPDILLAEPPSFLCLSFACGTVGCFPHMKINFQTTKPWNIVKSCFIGCPNGPMALWFCVSQCIQLELLRRTHSPNVSVIFLLLWDWLALGLARNYLPLADLNKVFLSLVNWLVLLRQPKQFVYLLRGNGPSKSLFSGFIAL